MEEICNAIQAYYRQCLILALQRTDYVPNRHIAGYELVGWFKSLWGDPDVPREYLARLKAMLRDLLMGSRVPQEALVTAVLEHLFEIPEIAQFFADWKSDPLLGSAFALSMQGAAPNTTQ